MNNKLIFIALFMAMTALFVNAAVMLDEPSFELSATSGLITTNQGETGETIPFNITNNGNETLEFFSFQFVPESFQDVENNQITLTFTDIPNLEVGNSSLITISATPEVDQYLDTLSGTITISGRTVSGVVVSRDYSLSVETTSKYVKLDLDDSDLDDLEPGNDIKFDIEVDNIFSTEVIGASEDLENVKLKAWIMGIDDNDDLDETSSKEDIDDGDDYNFDFEFKVPLNVDEGRYDIKVKIEGETREDGTEFEAFILYENVVEVVKDEDERVEFEDLEFPTEGLTCGSTFVLNIDAINTGEDDLDEMYLKLEIEGTDVSIKSDEFDLDSNDYDDRKDNVEFRVTLPEDLDKEVYTLKILAYNDDNDLIDGEYTEITVTPCVVVGDDSSDDSDSEEVDQNQDQQNNNQVEGFIGNQITGLAILDKETWSTVFWILGNIVLVIIAIYFVTLIFRKRR